MSKYILVNIGCIECGVSSAIVGVFTSMQKAEEVQSHCDNVHSWRQGGQNSFEIFEIPEIDVVDPEYLSAN